MRKKKNCGHKLWRFAGHWDIFRNNKRVSGGPKFQCIGCGKSVLIKWNSVLDRKDCPHITLKLGECFICGGVIREKAVFRRILGIFFVSVKGICCERCGKKYPFPSRG